jgi:hypothetical protein
MSPGTQVIGSDRMAWPFSQQIAELLRLDATIGQYLPQEPQSKRARSKWNDRRSTVRMPQKIVAPSDTLRNEAARSNALTSSFPVGRGSVLRRRSSRAECR